MENNEQFFKGMNQDLSKSKIQNGYYFSLLNGTLVTDEGLTSGDISTIKGNKLLVSIPKTSDIIRLDVDQSVLIPGGAYNFNLTINSIYTQNFSGTFNSLEEFFEKIKQDIETSTSFGVLKIRASYNSNYMLIYSESVSTLSASSSQAYILISTYASQQSDLFPVGWCTIRDKIYILSTNETSGVPLSMGQIWELTYNKQTLTSVLTLKYNNFINLSSAHPIANPGMIEGRYESQKIQKIYWTDKYNSPRYINIADPLVFAKEPQELSLVPLNSFSQPKLQEVVQSGGSLYTGSYQVGYRLKNTGGVESSVSALSRVTHITDRSEINDGIITYWGQQAGVQSSKQLKYILDGLNTSYERIEIISIYRKDNSSSPDIKIISDEPIPANGHYEFFVTGNEGSPISMTLFELLSRSINFETVGTLGSKKNYLLLGDIKTSILDLNYDARATRFTAIGLGTPQTYTIGTFPDQKDDINPDQNPRSASPYLYKSDGVTLGGEGANISYEFVTLDQISPSGTFSVIDDNFPGVSAKKVPYKDVGKTADRLSLGTNDIINQSLAFPNSGSPYIAGGTKGYKRGETYRFGIVFYDRAGNPGYVLWIGDIRFPDIYMPDPNSPTNLTLQFGTTDFSSSKLIRKDLGIRFSVNVPPSIKAQISGYSIVRVQRKESDKTVIGQGLFYPAWYDAQDGRHYLVNHNTQWDFIPHVDTSLQPDYEGYSDNVGSFSCPEFQFKGFPGFQSGDTLEINGILQSVWSANIIDSGDNDLGTSSKVVKNYQFKSGNVYPVHNAASSNPYPLQDVIDMPDFYTSQVEPTFPNSPGIGTAYNRSRNHGVYDNGALVNNSDEKNSQGNKTIAVKSYGFLNFAMPGSTGFGIFGGDFPFLDGMNSTFDMYLADYRRTTSNQYGGNTVSKRSQNTYISTGHLRRVSEISPSGNDVFIVFGGDTFISVMDIAHQFKDWTGGNGSGSGADGNPRMVTRLYPVETSVNIELRRPLNGDLNGPRVPNKIAPQDVNDPTHIDLTETFNVPSFYNIEDNLKEFYPKDINFQENSEFDTRVYKSDPKINGEQIDSWTIFRPNNYIDLESKFGPLNTIIHNNNELYFLQNEAIGTLAIDEKSLIEDASGASLVLGTGGVLNRFDYISTGIGSSHKFSVSTSPDSFLFYDKRNRMFYKCSGREIFPLFGMSSYINRNLQDDISVSDNPLEYRGIISTYDHKYKQYLITWLNSSIFADKGADTQGTLSYNDTVKNWHSLYSFTPVMYINDNENIISFKRLDSTGWVHDKGPYTNFYGQNFGLSIQKILNSYPESEKIFDNLEMDTEVLSPSGVLPQNYSPFTVNQEETFSHFQIYNDYQNTGLVPLVKGDNLKRQKRIWNFSIGGNRVKNSLVNMFAPSNLYTYPLRPPITERIKSTWCLLNLYFSNTQNHRLSLRSLKSKFRANSR